MSNLQVQHRNGIFLPLLTVLFIGLKLTDHIDWSWIWVLSPIWIQFLLLFIFNYLIELKKEQAK